MKDYKKYKWFYTSSGKLVIGGKNAEQNDELLTKLKGKRSNYLVMHTASPGSPFSVIISPIRNISKKDLTECAIFTGCFSRAWKEKKMTVAVDVFHLRNVVKTKIMKTGTWGVQEKIKRFQVELSLVLTKQKKIYRSVPESSIKNKQLLLRFTPGRIEKDKFVNIIIAKLNEDVSKKDELVAALPPGGFKLSDEKRIS